MQRWVDLTPGAAMTDLVRVGLVRLRRPGTERTLDFADTWAAAVQPLLVLLALDGDRGLARRALDAVGAPDLRGLAG